MTHNTVRETAAHRVPGASIEVSPTSGPGGTRVTLTGAGFKAFTSLSDVSVGGVPVQENPSNPTVGRDGVLQSTTILIPGLDPGTHTVRATVGEPTVSVSFTITADGAPLPSTGDQTPAAAFKELIDSGNLLTVYWFDAASAGLPVLRSRSGQRRVQRPGDGQRRGSLLGPAERGHDLPREDPVR